MRIPSGVLCFALWWLTVAVAPAEPACTARYVFLFIGDGMGSNQVAAVDRALAASGREPLVVNGFPVKGSQRTRSASHAITDSAAAGTALATGVRTSNGVIGLDPGGAVLRSLAEEAKAGGRKVGILSSVSLDHATPASFYAHARERGSYSVIARALADSSFDFFGGGGLEGQAPSRVGEPDNLQRAISNGFTVVRTREKLAGVAPGARVLAFNHRLAGSSALPAALDMLPDDISLAEFTAACIRLLHQENGFFLMVEGGKIDWACHDNDAGTMAGELLAFDQAIRQAVEFSRLHPGETLIVVTADHETGGLEAWPGDGPFRPAALLGQKRSGTRLKNEIKALRGSGAGFEQVRSLLKEGWGLELHGLSEEDARSLQEAWDDHSIIDSLVQRVQGRNDPLLDEGFRALAKQAGYRFTTGGHTGADVPVWASGVGATAFAGAQDNTEIHGKIRAAMGIR